VRVLFVVDNGQWVRAAEGLAERFEVEVVPVGRKVPGRIRDYDPHVLVLDIKLPHLNGVTVAHLLREDWPDLPIVFASDEYDPSEACLPEMTAFLPKPYSAAMLADLITRAATYKSDSFCGRTFRR